MKSMLFVVPMLVVACSVTRPTALPVPSASAQDRITYPALLVTDSTGRARWVYDAWVEGDTLRGQRAADAPRARIAMPLSQVKAVAAPRFSTGRTVGLIGGMVGVVLAAVLLAPDPVYAVAY